MKVIVAPDDFLFPFWKHTSRVIGCIFIKTLVYPLGIKFISIIFQMPLEINSFSFLIAFGMRLSLYNFLDYWLRVSRIKTCLSILIPIFKQSVMFPFLLYQLWTLVLNQ